MNTEPITLRRDGNQWMATFADFVDLVQSPAGFGDTEDEARADLVEVARTFRVEPPMDGG